jgi:hypothetical protein
MRVGNFSKNSNVFPYIVIEIPSHLTKHTRSLLTTCVLVLKFLGVILLLYEQFNESSSSLCSRFRYGTGRVLPSVFTTDGKIVICRASNESIGCSMTSQLE